MKIIHILSLIGTLVALAVWVAGSAPLAGLLLGLTVAAEVLASILTSKQRNDERH